MLEYASCPAQVPLEWLQYLDSIRKEVKVILIASPTGGIASADTRQVILFQSCWAKTNSYTPMTPTLGLFG